MVRAARDVGMQVIWDSPHFGWPDDLNVFSPDFIWRSERLGARVRLTRYRKLRTRRCTASTWRSRSIVTTTWIRWLLRH